MELPPPDPASEEAFVGRWRDEDADPDALIGLVEDAVRARRPQLAARLLGLLPADELPDDLGPELRRAQRTAQLLLVQRSRFESVAWDAAWGEVKSLWGRARLHRGARATQRARDALRGASEDHRPGHHRRRRKRRK